MLEKNTNWMTVKIIKIKCFPFAFLNVDRLVPLLNKIENPFCESLIIFSRTEYLFFNIVWFVVHLNRKTVWITRDLLRVSWKECLYYIMFRIGASDYFSVMHITLWVNLKPIFLLLSSYYFLILPTNNLNSGLRCLIN